MTIGPEPMTSTLAMSSRFGMSALPSLAPTMSPIKESATIMQVVIVADSLIGADSLISGRSGGEHQVGEAVEEVAGVVRAGRGLGVVLHREGRDVETAQPLDDAVVEPDVADLDPADVGAHRGVERGVHR